MKMFLIAALAIPFLGVGIGYGAGIVLAGGQDKPEQSATEHGKDIKNEAKALINAAEENADNAADPHAAAPKAAPKPDHSTTAAHGSGDQAGTEPADGHSSQDAAPQPAKRSLEVVKLGQITVPIYKPLSVTYVVADLGVAMADADTAAHYRIAENATRLRDTIVTSFLRAAANPKMRRPSLDSDWLSETLTKDLNAEYDEAKEVLFLTLFKKDVPRS